MQIKGSRAFPYPLLSKMYEDYLSSTFKIEMNYLKSRNEINLQLKVLLENMNLEMLIKDKKAIILCHVECPKTKYRTVKELNLGKNKISFASNLLDGYLEIVPVIVANTKIDNFYSKDFNKDYERISFEIEKGSILAIGEQLKIPIKKELGTLSKIPSIFQIEKNINKPEMEVEMHGEKLVVKLPEEEYNNYGLLKGSESYNNILISMIIFPALIFVLSELENFHGLEMYEDRRWYRVLNKKLREEGFDLKSDSLGLVSILKIAQKILDLPLFRATESLKNLEVNE